MTPPRTSPFVQCVTAPPTCPIVASATRPRPSWVGRTVSPLPHTSLSLGGRLVSFSAPPRTYPAVPYAYLPTRPVGGLASRLPSGPCMSPPRSFLLVPCAAPLQHTALFLSHPSVTCTDHPQTSSDVRRRQLPTWASLEASVCNKRVIIRPRSISHLPFDSSLRRSSDKFKSNPIRSVSHLFGTNRLYSCRGYGPPGASMVRHSFH